HHTYQIPTVCKSLLPIDYLMKQHTPTRRCWISVLAQPFLVIAARDASSISDDRQKSGQVLVRTEPIIQMILGRFRGGMSGVLNFAFDKRNTLFYSCVDETQDQATETEEHGKQLAYDRSTTPPPQS